MHAISRKKAVTPTNVYLLIGGFDEVLGMVMTISKKRQRSSRSWIFVQLVGQKLNRILVFVLLYESVNRLRFLTVFQSTQEACFLIGKHKGAL